MRREYATPGAEQQNSSLMQLDDGWLAVEVLECGTCSVLRVWQDKSQQVFVRLLSPLASLHFLLSLCFLSQGITKVDCISRAKS